MKRKLSKQNVLESLVAANEPSLTQQTTAVTMARLITSPTVAMETTACAEKQ